MHRTTLFLAALVLGISGLTVTTASATASSAGTSESLVVAGRAGIPKAVNGAKISKSFRAAVAALPLANENRSGYDRDKFKHWNDVDRDCQNARSEVLRSESKKKATGKCAVSKGKWLSYYDQVTVMTASKLDVDHMVPLAEAWDSGARSWSAAKRQAYANDLTERRTLVAVTARSNRSKSDQDPAEWLPEYKHCRYALEWTVVKTRWKLTVDAAEKEALTELANRCSKTRFTTYKAVVKTVGGGSSSGGSGGSSGGSGGGGGNCTPGYRPCLPPKSDYDCAGGSGNGPGYANGPIYVTGNDPYDLDRDGDGVACE